MGIVGASLEIVLISSRPLFAKFSTRSLFSKILGHLPMEVGSCPVPLSTISNLENKESIGEEPIILRSTSFLASKSQENAFSNISHLDLIKAVLFLLSSMETYRALIDSSILGTQTFILRFSTSCESLSMLLDISSILCNFSSIVVLKAFCVLMNSFRLFSRPEVFLLLL